MMRVRAAGRVLNTRVCPTNQIGEDAAILKMASCVNGVEDATEISPEVYVLTVGL